MLGSQCSKLSSELKDLLTIIFDGKNLCFAAAAGVAEAEDCTAHEQAQTQRPAAQALSFKSLQPVHALTILCLCLIHSMHAAISTSSSGMQQVACRF